MESQTRVIPKARLLILTVLVLFSQSKALADVVTINFESFPDNTSLTTQFPGLTFSNATVIMAGISLNEFEFPPHSGTNVVFDDGGPISIAFASQISAFGAYFTYDEPLTLAAFDGSHAQVAITTATFSSNDALFGDPGSSSNEFLQVDFPDGISSITITGDPAGNSFVMDDLTVTSAAPEPTFRFLLIIGLAAVFALHKRLL